MQEVLVHRQTKISWFSLPLGGKNSKKMIRHTTLEAESVRHKVRPQETPA